MVGCILSVVMSSWFHANVPDLKSAESLLLKKGFDGSYLVRRSTSTKGAYSLSVRSHYSRQLFCTMSSSIVHDCYHNSVCPSVTLVIHA